MNFNSIKKLIAEVVIAAPFENDGRGAVYLYMGSELDGSYVPKCAQKIAGTDTQGYFGYSLASLTDLRGNGMHGKTFFYVKMRDFCVWNLYRAFETLTHSNLQ